MVESDYVPPTFDGEPYERPCGCHGNARVTMAGLVVDHFVCEAHETAARLWYLQTTGATLTPPMACRIEG